MARPKAITKLSETPNVGNHNWLIYSGAGIGKSVLAGTSPKSLTLTVEAAGMESAKAFGSETDEWIIHDWQEFREAATWVANEGHKEYDWLNVDSVSEMEELCWTDQLESINKEFEARIQDYGIVDRKIKKMIDGLNRLPINVLYTAQQMAFTTEDSEGDDILKVLPKIGRTKDGAPLSNLVCGKMTLVGLLSVVEEKGEEDRRRLWVQGGEQWVAKDRHDTFGKYIDYPDIQEMEAAVAQRRLSTQKKTPAKAPKKSKKKENVDG